MLLMFLHVAVNELQASSHECIRQQHVLVHLREVLLVRVHLSARDSAGDGVAYGCQQGAHLHLTAA